jgi:hypothetical protein
MDARVKPAHDVGKWGQAFLNALTAERRHCEERSDEAIQFRGTELWIASLRSQ